MKVSKWVKWFALVGYIVVTIGFFPIFFEKNPQYRFFFLLLTCILIVTILLKALCIVTTHNKNKVPRQYILAVVGLGLDIIAAYRLYNWQIAIEYFPILKKIPETTIMIVTGFVVLLAIFIWGVYRILKDESGRKKLNVQQDVRELGAETVQTNSYNTQEKDQGEENIIDNSLNNNFYDKKKVSFTGILGYVVATMAILVMAGVIFYMLLTNKNILESLSMDLVKEISYAMVWFILILILLLVGILLAVTAVKYFRKMIEAPKWGNIHDNSFLRFVSIVILAMAYISFPNETIDKWTMFIVVPEEIAPILRIVSVLIFGFIFFELIYLILRLILNPSEKIKRYVIKIWDELLSVISDSIISLVKMVKYIPDVLKLLTEMISEEDEDFKENKKEQ